MKNKKGFTLIELLAVIVILAILLVIAVPQILNVIEESRKKAAVESAQMFVKALNDSNQISNLDSNYTHYSDGNYIVSDVKNTLKLDNTWPEDNSTFTIANEKVTTACLVVNGYNVSCNGRSCIVSSSECASGSSSSSSSSSSSDYTYHYQDDQGNYLTSDTLPNGIDFYGKVHKTTGTQSVCLIASGGEVCLDYGYWDCGDVENGVCENPNGYIGTKMAEAASKGASTYVDVLKMQYSYGSVTCTNPYTGNVDCYDPNRYMCRITNGELYCRNPY